MKKGLTIRGEQSGNSDRQRDNNVDLLRIIACIAVVGLHTFPKNVSVWTTALYYLCGFGVPFFFMSSGYFLLNRGVQDWKYFIKKVVNIFRVIVCWNVIFFLILICKNLTGDNTITITWLTLPILVIRSLLQKTDAMWQLWYLGALMIIYLTLPILSRMQQKRKRQFLLVLGGFMILIDVCSIIKGYPIQRYIPQPFRLWTWLFYFILGGEIRKFKEYIISRFSLKAHTLIAGFSTILVVIYQCNIGWDIVSTKTGEWLRAEYFYDNILEIFWIILLFSLGLRLDTRGITRYITKLAPLTMGIYIIHPLIRDVTVLLTGNYTLVRALLYWILTFILSCLITSAINKTPIGKYLVRV